MKKKQSSKNNIILFSVTALILFGNLISGISCRNDPSLPKAKIESITFDTERVTLSINEEATVKVTVKPNEAKRNEDIVYTSTNEGIVELSQTTNDGLIVKGLKGGSTVIVAKSEMYTGYLEVIVTYDTLLAQYINVGQPVIELNEGSSHQVQVSLYGGNALDNNYFTWAVEEGKNNISIQATQNVAVIKGERRGYQKVIVSHTKAEYKSEILVFVRAVDEAIKYITSEQNVVVVPIDGQYHDVMVSLVNGGSLDNTAINFNVTEGAENIDIIGNANVVNIKGEAAGSSVVTVTHPDCEVPFEIRVFTIEIYMPFIILDQTFAILNIGDYVNITAAMENPRDSVSVNSQFTYTAEQSVEGVVEIMQTNNSWWIRGNASGTARIRITNPQAELSKEILVIVRNVISLDYFITTSQNVIMTQVGEKESTLYIQLVNGNEADANSFDWLVDDSSIINVESGNGNVQYSRSTINAVQNGIAVITPKKAGTAKITIGHYKSQSTLTVMVKVYPRNTFASLAPNLVGEGLYKVIKGTPLPVNLNLASGSIANIGSLNWTIREPNIATVDSELAGLTNVIHGISTGLTKLTVSGEQLEYPMEALVASGTVEELSMLSVIYVDNVYQKIVTDQVVQIQVKDANNLYTNSNDFKVDIEDTSVVYAVMVKNMLMMQGKERGETKVVVTHPQAQNISVTINVRVDPAYIDIDKPFYLSGPEIVGIVRGVDTEFRVSLVGASDAEKGKMVWSVDDSGVLTILGNGEQVRLKGRQSDTQTKVRITHPKSENEKVILVYVVENESDLINRVVLSAKNENYLLMLQEEVLVSLITNASDIQKSQLQWDITHGADMVSINANYDSAMIRGIGAGHAEVVVRHPANIIPLTLYVSVVEAYSSEKVIKGPAIIEVITQDNRMINVSHRNLTPVETSNIRWNVEDARLANITENGDYAHVLGLQAGISFVNIRQDQIGYRHRPTLVIANSQYELETMHVMGATDTYYRITVGDEVRIPLVFGSGGFPDTAKRDIQWIAGDNNVVRVIGNGDAATVEAVYEGFGTVRVVSPESRNEVLLNFEVRNKFVADIYEFRGHDKIIGIVTGDTATITMKMYQGSTEISSGYSLLRYENDDDNVASVNLVDNIISITGKGYDPVTGIGQTYVTVRHDKVLEPARILIYVAKDQDVLDNYYPISVDKTNYLIQVGESATITINTIGSKDTQSNLDKISWGTENSSFITYMQNGKKSATVTGRYPGQSVVNIHFDGNLAARVYIAVVENNDIDPSKTIVTENIIGMVKGKSRKTVIQTNLPESEIASLIWESTNTGLITVSGSGREAIITANGIVPMNNEAYVTVSYGTWLKRHILVYVCNEDVEVPQYRAMNIENQYLRLGRNETVIVPIFYAPNKPMGSTQWSDRYGNNVVEFTPQEGDKITITSLNEGVAVIDVSNPGRNNNQNPVRLYVEVSNRYTNLPKTPELKYLTVSQTLWVLNPDEGDTSANITVIGVGMSQDELNMVKWAAESGNQYVSIYPNGPNCKVLPRNAEGTAVVRASYGAGNFIDIKIIVSRKPVYEDITYINMEDIVRLGNGDQKLITVMLQNGGNYNKNDFNVQVLQGVGVVTTDMAGDVLSLTGLKTGQALIKVTHPLCAFGGKEVVIIVTSSPDGLVYLTTRDNFSVVKVDGYNTLTVELVGTDDNGQGYTWEVNPEHTGILSIQPSVRQVQVSGRNIGIAQIRVRHAYMDSGHWLSLWVRVTEMDIVPVYISTPRNIVTVTAGANAYLTAELVNGGPENSGSITWYTANTNIVSLEGIGPQAMVVAKEVGIARISVRHTDPSVVGMEILVVVEVDHGLDGVYIATDSTLVTMRKSETRTLLVQLVGGNQGDNTGFNWAVTNNEVFVGGVKKNVISMEKNNERAHISALEDGEATIEVKHIKARYALVIKVVVQSSHTIWFTIRSLTLTVGQTQAVGIESPAHVNSVYCESIYPKIVSVSNWTKNGVFVTGLQVGTSVVSVRDIANTMSDEILVEVRNPATSRVQYIRTQGVLFNMTDLNIGANRLRVSASTVGEKVNGELFTVDDDKNIRWAVVAGNDVVTLNETNYALNHNASAEAGSQISIGPIQPGEATIRLTHLEMPNYSHDIFVNVLPHDDSFTVTQQFIAIMEKENEKSFSWNINNIENPDYSQVSLVLNDVEIWGPNSQTENYTDSVTGLSVQISKDSKGNNYTTATVRGDKHTEGRVQLIYVKYKGKSIPVNVLVTQRAKFEIYENYIIVSPGVTNSILITELIPEDTVISTKLESDLYLKDFIWVDRTRKTDVGTISGKEFQFTGTDNEGSTRIWLTGANGIQKAATINNTRNLLFLGKNRQEIRGHPGDSGRFHVSIQPRNDRMYMKEDENSHMTNGKVIINVKTDSDLNLNIINEDERYFDYDLENSGVTVLRVHSDKNDERGQYLDIPVLVYWPYINVEWKLKRRMHTTERGPNSTSIPYSVSDGDNPKGLHSRISDNGNAIFLASGEEIIIYPSVDKTSPYPNGFPNHDLVLNGVSPTQVENGGEGAYANNLPNVLKLLKIDGIWDSYELFNFGLNKEESELNGLEELMGGIEIRIDDDNALNRGRLETLGSGANSDISQEILYLGTVNIHYQYFTGTNLHGNRTNTFLKSFLLYYERYRRTP
jgi:hypothetical protein